MTFKC